MTNNLHYNKIIFTLRLCLISGMLFLVSCSPFQPLKSSNITTYTIDAQLPLTGVSTGDLTLLVSLPSASSGYDSPRMIYLKKAHEIDYYSQNQWVDSPGRMLAPLLVQALESAAKFRSVVNAHSAAKSELRLDTNIIRLQHEFLTHPSQVHLTIRAQLIDLRNHTVLGTREFDVIESATSDDPYGGVLATNRAVITILSQIADFCVKASQPAK